MEAIPCAINETAFQLPWVNQFIWDPSTWKMPWYLMPSSGRVNPTSDMTTTVEMLKITETTPTIAIFWSKLIFFLRANIRASKRHPKLNPILYRFPVALYYYVYLLSYIFIPNESLKIWHKNLAKITWKQMVIPQGYIIIQNYASLLRGTPKAANDISLYDLNLFCLINLTMKTMPIQEKKAPRNMNIANGTTPIC